jgi:SAM-dependent methyltransferase
MSNAERNGSGGSGPPYRLNIGAGHTYIPGMVNVDISDVADVTLDLSSDRLPFEDGSVDLVFSLHTLEHIPDYLFALGEIHRVLAHDGELLLKLPYVTLTELHLVNPYHLHNFSERSFDLFDPALLKGSAAEGGDVAFRKVCVRYSYMGVFPFAPAPLRTWARRHLLNVVRQFDIGLVAIKDPERPVRTDAARAREMEARMTELARARRPYPGDVGAPTGAPRRASTLDRVAGRVRRRVELKTR